MSKKTEVIETGVSEEVLRTSIAKLENKRTNGGLDSEESDIYNTVQELLHSLLAGEQHQVQECLVKLGAHSDSDLYKKVGEMTRSLHESLRDLRDTLDPSSITMVSTNIPDAADKLETVIQATHEAAHQTLEYAEQQGDLMQTSKKEIVQMQEYVTLHSEIPVPIKEKLQAHFSQQSGVIDEFQKMNLNLLMTQEYQDLTGQALRKVIKLVSHLEENLVTLVKIFGGSGQKLGEVNSAEAASEKAEELVDDSKQKVDQDDVDSLLSSLGF